MDKKMRIVLDAGDDTALFVEQNSEGDYLATMYPFKESALVLKTRMSMAWSLVLSILFFLAITFMAYGIWGALQHSFPSYYWVIGFVLLGLLMGGFFLSKQMFVKAKKDMKDKKIAFVREILRDMKSRTAEPIEQYSIKASYLYNGMDGDFITWYKQEKAKMEMNRLWEAP